MGETVESAEVERAAWLQERRSGIGGSDAAAILGLSRWSSPLQVWLDKRGELPDRESEPMWWGRELEDVIAKRYELETSLPLTKPGSILYHPEHACLLANPDRLAPDRGVEIKTARSADDWGRPGSDEVPIEYFLQSHHYMNVTGLRRWDIAVLFAGSDFRIYTIWFDPEVEQKMCSDLVGWWRTHIVGDQRPPIDGTSGTKRWLSDRFPREIDDVAPAPETADAIAAELHEARTQLDSWELKKAECENRMKALIGEAAGFDSKIWRCSWKRTKDGSDIDWEKLSATLLGALDPPVRAEIIAMHTVPKPGVRRFLFTYPKKAKR